MQDYFKELQVFKPVQKDGYIEMTLPVALDFCFSLLTVNIYTYEDSFKICTSKNYFKNCNDTSSYYYELFNKNDKNNHYNIQLENDIFFKEYPKNYNPNVALNEFARFFLYLNDFYSNLK